MIKGVNKRIIEVNPKNEYFDRIILFVNPASKCSQQVLTAKADECISSVTTGVAFKSSAKKKVFKGISFLLSAVAGGSAALLLFGR